MKKTLAILLSCVVLVAAFFAVAMITSADSTEVYASTVEVILADGTYVYLGKQPVIATEGEDAGEVIGYSDTNIINILALKEGTMKFDETTGTLTLDGVNGVKKIASYTGSLVVIAKGTNEIKNDGNQALVANYTDYVDPDASPKVVKNVGNLTVKGDGSLTVSSARYTTLSQSGNIEITGDVTFTSKAVEDAMHVSSAGNNGNFIKFSGNSKTSVEHDKNSGIRNNKDGSSVYITDNAQVSIKTNATTAGGSAINTKGDIEISGGSLTATGNYGNFIYNESSGSPAAQRGNFTMKGGTVTLTGVAHRGIHYAGGAFTMSGGTINIDIAVQGSNWGSGIKAKTWNQTGGAINIKYKNPETTASAMQGIDVQSGASAVFAGGTLNIDVNNAKNNRNFGLFFKDVAAVNFSGTIIDVKVTNSNDSEGRSGCFSFQGTCPAVTFSAGKITYNTNTNFLNPETSGMTVAFTGGNYVGSAKAFSYVRGGNPSYPFTLNISGGNFDTDASSANFNNPSSVTVTQPGTAVGATDKSFNLGTVVTPSVINPVNPDTTCTGASNAVKTPVDVTEKSAEVAAVIWPVDSYITVNATTPYVGDVDVISVSGNKMTQATKQFSAAPAAPVNVAFTNITTTGATVTWEATEATSFAVYVGGQKVGETDQKSFDLTGLTEKTQYKVQIEASNQIGTSPKSAEVTLTTATEGVAASVTITPATGDAVELNAANTTYNGATGTAVFDAATGTVTITDLTGVQSITAAADVALTVTAKGTNVLESATANNSLYAGHLIVNGDGKLSVKNTKSDSYPILGGHSLTFAGSVEFSLTSTTSKHAVHVSRGNNDVGVADFIAKDNVKITLNTAKNAISVNGEKTSLIITDNAVVNITNTSGDALASVADKDLSYEGKPGAYTEISGNAKVTIVSGSCGIRNRYQADTAGLKTMEGYADTVIKDKANVDITAVGQVIYSYCDPGKGVDTDKASFTMTGNPTVKLVNTTKYQGISIKGDDNTVTLEGGTLEIIAPNATAFANDGKTTWNVNHVKTMVAGDDAASAAAVEEVNTSDKYFKIVMNNPKTSDNVLPVVAIVAGLSAIAVAAAVVLRKRYN